MFHHFYATVRKEQADNVIAAMQTIMVLIIIEGDNVAQWIFTILLANRKKGDHGILLVEQDLAENVIVQCGRKLNPFLVNEE